MKYFKYELWEKLNCEVEEVRAEAEKQWIENSDKYAAVFDEIKQMLPKKFLDVYVKENGFHDWKLKKLDIIHSSYGTKSPIEVNILISDDNLYKITYRGIKKIEIRYREDVDERRGFDDWGYCEFLPVNDKIISHEILFASGASIKIHFAKISINLIKE